MAKTWYQIIQNNVNKIAYVVKMSGYDATAKAQLFTDKSYTDDEIIALADAATPDLEHEKQWLAGFWPAYDKVREPSPGDPLPRFGGIEEEAK